MTAELVYYSIVAVDNVDVGGNFEICIIAAIVNFESLVS